PQFKFPLTSNIVVNYKMNENDLFTWSEPVVAENTPVQDRYRDMLRDFARKIHLGKMDDSDFEREARVHRLVLASCGIECDWNGKINL
ncbi:MAG: hypothetical protein IKD03_05115, partial [Clostridia bacterium]|nr:hypothetical protein [Clostridia bacterium]